MPRFTANVAFAVPPHLQCHDVKEELPPAITKVWGRTLHYLRGGGHAGASGSQAMVSEAECTARRQVRYDWRNAVRRSVFAKSDVAPEWVRNDPDLTIVWALDRSIITAGTAAKCRRRRLDRELTRLARSGRLAIGPSTPVVAWALPGF